MKLRNAIGASTVLLLAFSCSSLTMQAAAHDPRSDDHPVHQRTHQHTDSSTMLTREDLKALRDKVTVFRETGDDRYLEEAWEQLQPVLDHANAYALVTAAFIAQARHQFDGALVLVKRALTLNAHYDEAHLLEASIHLVRGDTLAAGRACRELRNVTPLVIIGCKARVAVVAGESHTAYARLIGVLNVVDDDAHSPDIRAWAHSIAGDLAVAKGRMQAARQHYDRSLSLAERTQVRAALVDVLLSQGEFEVAQQTLGDGAPALPLLVRRLIVAKRLDRLADLTPELNRIDASFKRMLAAEDWLHAREMARFYLDVADRPDLARRLALINVQIQREPEDLALEQRTRG